MIMLWFALLSVLHALYALNVVEYDHKNSRLIGAYSVEHIQMLNEIESA